MIPLPGELCRSMRAPAGSVFDCSRRPLQVGLLGDAWAVTVASVLLCRTRRAQVDRVLEALLEQYPAPALLSIAETSDVEELVRPCGLYRGRTRQLQRLSSKWDTRVWDDLRDLPGVGKYVADAVGLFCFGCTELESSDSALVKYAATYNGPTLPWVPEGVSVSDAVHVYRSLRWPISRAART